MNSDFIDGWFDCKFETDLYLEYASWLGQPNVYDCGLYVNRTVEEHDSSCGYGIIG